MISISCRTYQEKVPLETEIPKVYSPENIEPRWAQFWVAQNLYRPADESARPHFCLVIPPPNITGSLHMGHMLEHTEIDILMRWHRMRGENVLWLPGTDHAAIATQMIVERELGRAALPDLEGAQAKSAWQREGQRLRLEMGREKFLEQCWKWKEQNGGTIRRQMERLGTSVDWTRDRFTMDAGVHALRAGSFHSALRRRTDLSWAIHRQLVPTLRHGSLRPGSRARRPRRPPVVHPLSF